MMESFWKRKRLQCPKQIKKTGHCVNPYNYNVRNKENMP